MLWSSRFFFLPSLFSVFAIRAISQLQWVRNKVESCNIDGVELSAVFNFLEKDPDSKKSEMK